MGFNGGGLRPWEMQQIVKLYRQFRRAKYNQKDACAEVGRLMDRHPNTVQKLVSHLEPTVDLASQYLKANSLRLAIRVVREANVSESLDVLSRPNIGVLAPKATGSGDGQRGFMLSISADSCGAVKATAALIEGGHATTQREISGEDDEEWEGSPLSLPERSSGGSEESQDRRDPHPGGISTRQVEGDEGLQVIDVHPEEAKVVEKPHVYRSGIGHNPRVEKLKALAAERRAAREALKV